MTTTNVPPGFAQPGGRSTRQENKETELILPGLQATLRAAADVFAALLVITALLLMGRWVIWALITLFFFSEAWDRIQDAVIGKFYGLGAGALEVFAVLIKWGWVILGYQILRLLVPVEWTLDTIAFRRAVIEPQWPFVWGMAARQLPFAPLTRIVFLVCCVVPLFSWRPLRDRLQWALWEFTPFGPVNVAEQGIDPHKWGPMPAAPQTVSNTMGIIFERTDYNPHVERVAEGVYLSNGSGRSSLRVDLRWVTEEQWRAVAKLLLIDEQPFTEETLGRGRVFPTHGPYSDEYGYNLGFRAFRTEMVKAGRAQYKQDDNPNAGVVLTEAGVDFLRRRFLDGAGYEEDGDANRD